MFQRPGDIVVSLQGGSIDFGITGYDVLAERQVEDGRALLVIHDDLGFGSCSLNLAVPEASPIADLNALRHQAAAALAPLRIATKFPRVTAAFLDRQAIDPYRLVGVEGTLEIAPAIGYANLICDLVSTGTTLRDNHLRPLDGGVVLRSQAVLVANRAALRKRPAALAVARHLLEYIEAHPRGSFMITKHAGESAAAIARRMFAQTSLGGLQGPTIAPVLPRDELPTGAGWFRQRHRAQRTPV